MRVLEALKVLEQATLNTKQRNIDTDEVKQALDVVRPYCSPKWLVEGFRDNTQEMGELKRIVNSFLQNLDSLGRQSIVLAATNHEELLDNAVWRRFSYRLALDFPTPPLRLELWTEFLGQLKFTRRELELLVDISEGFSGSDIQEVCIRLHRRGVTTKHPPRLNDAFQVLQNLAIGEGEDRRFVAQLKGKDGSAIAAALHKRNAKLYSFSALAKLFGVSKATAHRWAVKEDESNG